MKRLLAALPAVLMLSSCFTAIPLVRDPGQPLAVESLVIDIAPLDEGSGSGGVLGVVSSIQQMAKAFEDAMDEEKVAALHAQLMELERILVQGLADHAGATLLPRQITDIQDYYDTNGNLSSIEYIYGSVPSGDRIRLEVDIDYHQKSSSGLNIGFISARTWSVKPRITLLVIGVPAAEGADPFWLEQFSWNSPVSYKFGGTYILGLTPDEIQDAEIFLIPVSRGLMDSL